MANVGQITTGPAGVAGVDPGEADQRRPAKPRPVPHFTPEELPQHRGWGHSDWRQCAEFAAATGAGELWLFHHKPGRTDRALDDIRGEAQKVFPKTETATEETTVEV